MREKGPRKAHREERQGRWIGLCDLLCSRKYRDGGEMKKKKRIENK